MVAQITLQETNPIAVSSGGISKLISRTIYIAVDDLTNQDIPLRVNRARQVLSELFKATQLKPRIVLTQGSINL